MISILIQKPDKLYVKAALAMALANAANLYE
jgi:hypothetical protein